jgi:pyruvate/2-oxoglutarate dehydrogenase complex dihydrolipoamide dehydrogenase (E3) component
MMQILPKEDADARQVVLDSMIKDGVVFVFNTKFIKIEHTPATSDQVNATTYDAILLSHNILPVT